MHTSLSAHAIKTNSLGLIRSASKRRTQQQSQERFDIKRDMCGYISKEFFYFFLGGTPNIFTGRVTSWETDINTHAWIPIVLGLYLLTSCAEPRSVKALLEIGMSD